MPVAATSEFWKDIKPIANVFKRDALPEVYTANVAYAEEKYFIPITDTVSSTKPPAKRTRWSPTSIRSPCAFSSSSRAR